MVTPIPPDVDCTQHHPGPAVSDLPAAVEFYTRALGFHLAFMWGDPPTMAGVNLGHVQMFLEQGTPNPQGCTVYFVVDGVDDLYEYHRANDVDIVDPPGDRPWGMRDYTARDLHGYALTFGQHRLDTGPPIPVERVDVPMRLEKHLAALLADLAAHKRMSVSSCLEEILLHTCEPLGDGVANPHTARTLRHIAELKQKHGIDYDSHGSYRFVEPGTR